MDVKPQYHRSVAHDVPSRLSGATPAYRSFTDIPERREGLFVTVHQTDPGIFLDTVHLPTGAMRSVRVDSGVTAQSPRYCHAHPLGDGRALVWATFFGRDAGAAFDNTVGTVVLLIADLRATDLRGYGVVTNRLALLVSDRWGGGNIGVHQVSTNQVVRVDLAQQSLTASSGALLSHSLLVNVGAGALEVPNDWVEGPSVVSNPQREGTDVEPVYNFLPAAPGGWYDQPRELTSLPNGVAIRFEGTTPTAMRRVSWYGRTTQSQDVTQERGVDGAVVTYVDREGWLIS